jgi:pyruvate-formate lyase-activating enzyme
MTDCYKKIMSFWPFQYSMKCPFCGNLEWRNMKSVEQFNIEGCLRCRLIIGRDLYADDIADTMVRKKYYNYKVTGRYE